MKTLVKALAWLIVLGCSPSGIRSPQGATGDVVHAPTIVVSSNDDDIGADATEPEAVPEADTVAETTFQEVEDESTAPLTLAEQFVAADGAGGMKLCTAMIYALSPDWNMDMCNHLPEDEEGRQARCFRQREPLQKFAEDLCKTVIEESLRLNLDPGLPIAVMERESSIGRASFDSGSRAYRVQTDICQLYLSIDRIIGRKPGRREGSVLLSWTYAGGSGREIDRPAVIVEEDEEGLLINTCVAGETGLFQLLPSNYRSGTVIGTTGERLRGSTTRRREQVLEDPILQVRLGCQELDEHRDLAAEDQRASWEQWVHIYNTGRVEQGTHGREYAIRVAGHYLQACKQGWFTIVSTDNTLQRTVIVKDIWPECARVEAARDALRKSRPPY